MRTRTPEKRGYRLTAGRKALLAQGFSIEDILNNKTTMHINNTVPSASSAITLTEPTQQFDINQRFEFVEKLVKMVADGIQPSALIVGKGGVGKTHTVTTTLLNCGYIDISDMEEESVPSGALAFRKITGSSSAKGLYRSLYENNGKVIILDDCDSVFDSDSSLNILKGSLDSNDSRVISWNSEMKTDELPRCFEFTGSIIFISNRSLDSIDQAVRSRSMTVDLAMSKNETVERMSHIVCQGSFLPEYSDTIKMDALEFISTNRDKVKNLSLRSLITVAKIRAANDDWYSMAQYMTC